MEKMNLSLGGSKMYGIDLLVAEHQNILKFVGIMKSSCKDILDGKESHSRAVLEEIADVHIMLTQLLDDESDKTMVSLIVDKKLKRQMRRIKAEKDNRKTCKSCRWYTDESPLAQTGICFCSKSDECGNCADGNLMTCQEWERR